MAIKGYNSGAYFKDGKAVKGSKAYTFEWHGMTWYLTSAENRGLFAVNPE